MNKEYDELRNKAIEKLEEDDDLFVDMVNELHAWNGFADGYYGYPMYMLDDLYGDISLHDFLGKITDDFNLHDDYIVFTFDGVGSTNNIVELYKDNVFTDELVDNLVDFYPHITIRDSDLDGIIGKLADLYEE